MKKQNNYPTAKAMAPGILPGTRPEDLKAVTCKKCKEVQEVFIAVSVLRHASPLQTVSGQPMLVNFNNGFACTKCGAVNEFNIEGVPTTENHKEDNKDIN